MSDNSIKIHVYLDRVEAYSHYSCQGCPAEYTTSVEHVMIDSQTTLAEFLRTYLGLKHNETIRFVLTISDIESVSILGGERSL